MFLWGKTATTRNDFLIGFNFGYTSEIKIFLFDILFRLATFLVWLRISLVGLSPKVRHFTVAVEHVGCRGTHFDAKRESGAKIEA